MHETHPEEGRGKVTSPPVMFGLFVCISIPVASLPFHCACISTWQQKLCDQWKHSQFWPYSDWLKWCSLRNCVNQPKGLIVNHDSYCNQPGPLLSVLRFVLFLSLWWKKNKLNFFFCLAQLCLAVETANGGVEGGAKACSHFVINLSQKSCIQNTFLNSALSILL